MNTTKDKRIRGRNLQKIRADHRVMHGPLCVRCKAKGRVREWTQLDHTVALANGGKDIPSNRQGLCDECHDEKTAEDLGYAKPRRIGVDGFPVDLGQDDR